MPHFECGAIDHSATSPDAKLAGVFRAYCGKVESGFLPPENPPRWASLRPSYPAASIVVQTAYAVSFHVPDAIPRLDEAIDRSCRGRIAENIGMTGWIDTVKAARFHESTPMLVPPPIRARGRGAQTSQADDRYNRQESRIPPHRYFLLEPKKSDGKMAN
jgi:hypothetical protein